MILHALKEYYDRKTADPDSKMAPPGWEWKDIPFILVLNRDGKPVSLNSTVEGSGKTKRIKSYLLPQSVKKTSGVSSNLLWEGPEYALGNKSSSKTEEKHQAFKQRIENLGNISDPGFIAVKKFMEQADKPALLQSFGETWEQLLESGGNLTFQLAGEADIIANSLPVKTAIQAELAVEKGSHAVCLVTGCDDVIERLHPAIKGVWGAQTSGANIVSFNSEAFSSFGKKQGENSPVGKTAVFAYTTALNHLLRKDSNQRMPIGDASTVFWSKKKTKLEEEIPAFFTEPPKDDPDRNTRAVESLFNSPKYGVLASDEEDTTFYMLGLSPNASRISIRFWIVSTVMEMEGKIRQYFEDLKIVHGPKDRDAIPFFRILLSTASQGKADNIPPNLAGDTMRAILEGLPFPLTLLQAAIRRINAEHEITYPRAAIIKACINRQNRYINPNNKEELKVSLDLANTNIGYRLGRLFAALEKIQEEANPGINATIRDKFYASASGTPVTAFGSLMRLKNHHLSKLAPNREIFFEKLMEEIISAIKDLPAHLPLPEQGRFAIGYYHQRQDFFTKKTDKE